MIASPEIDFADANEASHFGVFLESLCFRMDELTTVRADTKTGPDVFCMFKSVLRIVHGTYEEMISNISRKSRCLGAKEKLGRFPSSCPMLNGSIKITEYWNVLNTSNATGAFDNHWMDSGDADIGSFPHFESWDAWELDLVDSGDLQHYA
jgi:hypothetical protein